MWSVLVCCALLSLQILAQPLTETTEDGRDKRQLDFGECCPCPRRRDGQDTSEDQFARSNHDAFSVIPTMDDCPCRPGRGDSDGAASIFFPTSMMRSNTPIDRPAERKEDPKPLLHPEVDLAASVLKTLRDVTDEEYRDALQRDAARSIARVTEDVLFTDANPQESSPNILTIVMNPRRTDNEDDNMPEPSHIQESRCIHSPPAPVKDISALRNVPKLRDLKMPRVRSGGLLHKKLFDMDSDVGASDIRESKIISDKISDTPGLTSYSPAKKFRSDLSKLSNSQALPNSLNIFDRSNKELDLSLSPTRNKLKLFDKAATIPDINDKIANSILSLRNNAINKLFAKSSNSLMLDKKPISDSHNFLLNRAQLKTKNTDYVKELNIPKLRQIKHLKPIVDRTVGSIHENSEEIPKLEKSSSLLRESVSDPIGSPSTMNTELKKFQPQHDNCYDNRKSAADNDLFQAISKEAEDGASEISPSEINTQRSLKSDQMSTDTCNARSDVVSDDEIIISESSNENEIAGESILGEKSTQMSNENYNNADQNVNNLEKEHICVKNTDTMSDEHLQEIPKSGNTEANLPEQSNNSEEESDSFGQQREIENDNNNCDETMPAPLEVTDVEGKSTGENTHDGTTRSDETDLVNSPSNNIDEVVKNTSNEETNDSSCGDDQQNNSITAKDDKNEPNTSINDLAGIPTTNVKENIMKKLETIRNAAQDILNKRIFERNNPTTVASTMVTSREAVDSDCDNDDTTVNDHQESPKANVENNLVPANTASNAKDAQDFNSDILSSDEEPQETSTASLPKVRDGNDCEVIEESFTSRSITKADSEVQDNASNLETSLNKESDSNTQASETIFNRVPLSTDNLGTTLRLHNTDSDHRSNILHLLPNTMKVPDLRDVMKKSDNLITDSLNLNLFNGNDGHKNSLKSVLEKNSLNKVNPFMVAETSKNDFRSSFPPERQSILDSSKKSLKSYRTNLPLLEDLSINPLNLQPLKIGEGVFGPNFEGRSLTDRMNLKNVLEAPLKLNNFDNGLIQQKESRNFLDVVTPLKSKNIFNEPRFGHVPNNVLTKNSQNLLETISRNHDDVNEKLRALHIDFNDRIDSMRNNLMDKWYSNEPRNRGILKSTKSGLSKQNEKKNKSPKSTQVMETRQKNHKLHPSAEERFSKPSHFTTRHRDIPKIKTPAIISPKTLHSPEIRTIPVKSLVSPKSSNSKYSVNSDGGFRSSPSLSSIKSKAVETPKKKLKLFKDSKVTLSMSTTPIPKLMSKMSRDHSGLPSERVHAFSRPSAVSQSNGDFKTTPSDLHAKNSPNPYKPLKHDLDMNINDKKISTETGSRDAVQSKNNNAWPEKNDSAFLAKVREALNSRRSKDNMKISNKPVDLRSNHEVKHLNTDMTRSASENFNVVEGEPLKENVGYTCKMVCTKHSTALKD